MFVRHLEYFAHNFDSWEKIEKQKTQKKNFRICVMQTVCYSREVSFLPFLVKHFCGRATEWRLSTSPIIIHVSLA